MVTGEQKKEAENVGVSCFSWQEFVFMVIVTFFWVNIPAEVTVCFLYFRPCQCLLLCKEQFALSSSWNYELLFYLILITRNYFTVKPVETVDLLPNLKKCSSYAPTSRGSQLLYFIGKYSDFLSCLVICLCLSLENYLHSFQLLKVIGKYFDFFLSCLVICLCFSSEKKSYLQGNASREANYTRHIANVEASFTPVWWKLISCSYRQLWTANFHLRERMTFAQ